MKQARFCFLLAALLLVWLVVPAMAADASVKLTKADVTEGIFRIEGTVVGIENGDRLLLAVYDADGKILSAAQAAVQDGCFTQSMPKFDVPDGDYRVKAFLTDGKGAPKAECSSAVVRYVNQSGTLYALTGVNYLVIGEGVGNGEVTLDGVTFTGETYVHGGGKDSIHIINRSSMGNITVAKTGSGAIRIASEEGSCVEFLQVADGKDDIIVEGTVNKLTVSTDTPVELKVANVGTVELDAPNANVNVAKDSVVAAVTVSAPQASVSVSEGAAVSVVKIEEAASEAKLTVEEGASTAIVDTAAPGVAIKAEGSVTQVCASAATTVSTTEQNKNSVTVLAAPGAEVTKEAGSEKETVETKSASDILASQRQAAKTELDAVRTSDYVKSVDTLIQSAKDSIDSAATVSDVLKIVGDTMAALAKEPLKSDQNALQAALDTLTGALQGAFSQIKDSVSRSESSLKQEIGRIIEDAGTDLSGIHAAVSDWSYAPAADGFDPQDGSVSFRLSVFKGQASLVSAQPIQLAVPARGKAQTPAAKAETVEEDRVVLSAVTGAEYRLGSGAWQDSPVFEGLNPLTKYSFYVRIKATEDMLASDSASVTIMTAPEGFLMIHNEDELLAAAERQDVNLYLAQDITLTKNLGLSCTIQVPENVTLTIDEGAELMITGIFSEPKLFGDGKLVLKGILSLEFLTPDEPGDYFPTALELDIREGSSTNVRACVRSAEAADWALQKSWVSQVQFFEDAAITGDLTVPQDKCLAIARGKVTLAKGAELAANGSLWIEDGGTLINNGSIIVNNELSVNEACKLTNNGTIMDNDHIYVAGELENNGKIQGQRIPDGDTFWYQTRIDLDANPVKKVCGVLRNNAGGTVDDEVARTVYYFGKDHEDNVEAQILGSIPGEDSNPGWTRDCIYTNDPALAFSLLSQNGVDDVSLFGALSKSPEDAAAVTLSGNLTVPEGKHLGLIRTMVFPGAESDTWFNVSEFVLAKGSTLTVSRNGGISTNGSFRNEGSLILNGNFESNTRREFKNNGSLLLSDSGNFRIGSWEDNAVLANSGTLENNGYMILFNRAAVTGNPITGTGGYYLTRPDALPNGSVGNRELEIGSAAELQQAIQSNAADFIHVQNSEEPIELTGNLTLSCAMVIQSDTTLVVNGTLTLNSVLYVDGTLVIGETGELAVNGTLLVESQYNKWCSMPRIENKGTLTVNKSGLVKLQGDFINNGAVNNNGQVCAYENYDENQYPRYGTVSGNAVADMVIRKKAVINDPNLLPDALQQSGMLCLELDFDRADVKVPLVITGDIVLEPSRYTELNLSADLQVEGRLEYNNMCVRVSDGTVTVAKGGELFLQSGGGLEIFNKGRFVNEGSTVIEGWLNADWGQSVTGNEIRMYINRASFARRFYNMFSEYLPDCTEADYDTYGATVKDWSDMFFENGHDDGMEGLSFLLKNGLIQTEADGRIRPYDYLTAAEEKAIYAAAAQCLGQDVTQFLNELPADGLTDASMFYCEDEQNPDNRWWESATDRHLKAFKGSLGLYMANVTSEAELCAALTKPYVELILIQAPITVTKKLEITEIPNTERTIIIAQDITLTVAQDAFLSLNRNTCMQVRGSIQVYGGINVFGNLNASDWGNQILEMPGGWVNTFCDTIEFTSRVAERLGNSLPLPQGLDFSDYLTGLGINVEQMQNWPDRDSRLDAFLRCIYYGGLRPEENTRQDGSDTVTEYVWRCWEYPTYGEIKSVLAALYQEIQHEDLPADVCLTDGSGEYDTDWCICDRDLDALLDLFGKYLPKQEIQPEYPGDPIYLTLIRHPGEDRDYYRLNNGQELDQTTLRNLRFMAQVSITAGSCTEDGFAGTLNFENCEFTQGITVQYQENMNFDLDFTDSCTMNGTTMMISLPNGVNSWDWDSRHMNSFRGVGGMLINAASAPGWFATETGFTLSATGGSIVFSGPVYIANLWYRDNDGSIINCMDFSNNADRETVVSYGSLTCDASVSGWFDLSGLNMSGKTLEIHNNGDQPTTLKLGKLANSAEIFRDFGSGYNITTTYDDTILHFTGMQEGCVWVNGEEIGYPHIYGPEGIYIGTVNETLISSLSLTTQRHGSGIGYLVSYLDDSGEVSQSPVKVHLTQKADTNWFDEYESVTLGMTVGGCRVIFDNLWRKYNSPLPVTSEQELLQAMNEGRPICLEDNITITQPITMYRGLTEDGHTITLASGGSLCFILDRPDTVNLSIPFVMNGVTVLPKNGSVWACMSSNNYGDKKNPELSACINVSGAVGNVIADENASYMGLTVREFCFSDLRGDCALELNCDYSGLEQGGGNSMLRVRSFVNENEPAYTVTVTGSFNGENVEVSGDGITDVRALNTETCTIIVGDWDRGTTVYTGLHPVDTFGRFDGETFIYVHSGAVVNVTEGDNSVHLFCGDQELYVGAPHIFGNNGIFVGSVGLTAEDFRLVIDGEEVSGFEVEEIPDENKLHINQGSAERWFSEGQDVSLTILWNGCELRFTHLARKLTRADMCVRLAAELNLSLENVTDRSFTDLPSDHPTYRAVMACMDMNLIDEPSDGTFDPDSEMTRLSAAMMLNRTTSVSFVFPSAEKPEDMNGMDPVLISYVRKVLSGNVMWCDENGCFNPDASVMDSHINWSRLYN